MCVNDCVFHCDWLLTYAYALCANCGLKILLFDLVLTVLTGKNAAADKLSRVCAVGDDGFMPNGR